MKKPAQFAEASTLRGSMTYVDQWRKVMAVVNANDIIALIIKEENGILYVAVASGDEYKKYIVLNKTGIGTMKKNMDALFDMYHILEGRRDIEKIPNDSCGCPKQLYAWDYLPHTKMAVIQHGAFHESFDRNIPSIIDRAEEIIGKTDADFSTTVIFGGLCTPVKYPETIMRDGLTMYHVGDGMYCDEEGDNWDVY